MLETIREYALGQLAAGGDEAENRRRHATFFRALARAARDRINSPERAEALKHVERDHDNLRAALVWALETGDAEAAQGLAGDMARFWMVLGLIGEGRAWLDQALALRRPVSPEARVEALYWASHLALLQAALDPARALTAEALALAEASGYRLGHAEAALLLGIEAEFSGDLGGAGVMMEEALAIFRELGASVWEGVALRHLGLLAGELGNRELAMARHEDALAVWRRLRHPWGIPTALRDLADEALLCGDVSAALAQYQEGIAHFRDLGERLHFPGCLWGIARVALAFGWVEVATPLLSAGDALFEAMGCAPWQELRSSYEEAVKAARAAMGDAAFAEFWAAGRALTVDEAIAEALALTETTVASSSEPPLG